MKGSMLLGDDFCGDVDYPQVVCLGFASTLNEMKGYGPKSWRLY